MREPIGTSSHMQVIPDARAKTFDFLVSSLYMCMGNSACVQMVMKPGAQVDVPQSSLGIPTSVHTKGGGKKF